MKRSYSQIFGLPLRRDFPLYVNLLVRPKALTLIFVASLGLITVYSMPVNDGFTHAQIIAAVTGNIAGFAFLKVTLMVVTYPLINHSPFDGSFLFASLATAFFLIIALACAAFIVGARVDDFPTAALAWFLSMTYVVVSLFLFVLFRLFHWLFERRKL